MRVFRKAFLVPLSAIAIASAGGVGVKWVSRALMFPGSATPLPIGSGVEVVDYRADDGVALRGAWCRAERRDGPVIVFFHGNAESAADNLDSAVRTPLAFDHQKGTG